MTEQEILKAFGELECENLKLKDQLHDANQKLLLCKARNANLETQVEELGYRIDGYEKCDVCEGRGGRYHPRGTTRQPDPQTWQDCPNCQGEGWVK